MARSRVTEWNVPRVLLAMVPETAPRMAQAAVDAYDIDPVRLNIPAPPSPEQLRRMSLDQRLAHPRVQALNEQIGSGMRAGLGAYPLAGRIFLPVFESALEADPVDEDLVRRCCAFLEAALAGEDIVAEGITLMVAENFGTGHTGQVRPYAGPLFRQALRSWKWID